MAIALMSLPSGSNRAYPAIGIGQPATSWHPARKPLHDFKHPPHSATLAVYNMGKDSIHDRYKEDRESGADVKSFFKALVSGSTASGMGHRVYDSADRGSGHMGQKIHDQSGAQVESGRVYVSEDYDCSGAVILAGTLLVRKLTEQYQAKPAPPTAPTATSPADVQRYLGPNQEFNPDYAAAVLGNFVRASLESGVESAEVAMQLDDLERRVRSESRPVSLTTAPSVWPGWRFQVHP